MGPFEITEKVSDVTYRLRLPPDLGHVHYVFHVSMLKNYTHDPSHILPYVEIPLQPSVTYKEQPAEILAREVSLFHNKATPVVKVCRERHIEEEATWELESEMYENYPHLF